MQVQILLLDLLEHCDIFIFNFQILNFNEQSYCARLVSVSANMHDETCTDQFPFLCQYDCDNPFNTAGMDIGYLQNISWPIKVHTIYITSLLSQCQS